MDFEKVLKNVIQEFSNQKISNALIGGFAISALGIPRATIDIDFLIQLKDCKKVKKILESLGYKCVFETENVSQYTSSSELFGEIDFIHAFRNTSLKMLQRAKKIKVFNNKLEISVLPPEDIIGLKLQASVNDKERKNREISDIESIMERFGKKLDWEIIKEHYALFNQKKEFEALKKKYEKIN
jgi:hypothetical protein